MTGTITVRDANRPKVHAPGDTIEVTFEWRLAEAPKTIEANLFWFTSGKGTQDLTIVETQPATPVARGDQRFKFKLPHSPYSFSGTLITLTWAVELVADDLAERWEFVMAPDAKEVNLERISDADPKIEALRLKMAEHRARV